MSANCLCLQDGIRQLERCEMFPACPCGGPDLQDAVTLARDAELYPLKAWRLWQNYGDYCLLAFAPTRNKAKSLCVQQAPEDWAYEDIRSGHLPHLDAFADRERVMVCNDELPAGCPQFWSDDE